MLVFAHITSISSTFLNHRNLPLIPSAMPVALSKPPLLHVHALNGFCCCHHITVSHVCFLTSHCAEYFVLRNLFSLKLIFLGKFLEPWILSVRCKMSMKYLKTISQMIDQVQLSWLKNQTHTTQFDIFYHLSICSVSYHR